MTRREWLYTVVREMMVRAGVLSSGYKFKVLSLDSRGSQFLVMMDLAHQYAGDVQRLAEIENQIAQVAKLRHDIVVTSVYWRVNDLVTTGQVRPLSGVTNRPSPQPVASSIGPRFEPLKPDEVEAFKQALASIPAPEKLSAPGEIIQSKRRNPKAMPTFVDTEMVDDRQSPLSGTQYGELN